MHTQVANSFCGQVLMPTFERQRSFLAGPRELVHGARESFIAKYRRRNTWLLVGSPATSAGAGGCSRGVCGDEAERMADGIHRDTAPRAAVLISCWAD